MSKSLIGADALDGPVAFACDLDRVAFLPGELEEDRRQQLAGEKRDDGGLAGSKVA